MEKWHINKEGKPARCRAVKHPCPLKGEHFDNKEQAEEFAKAKFEKKFGFLPVVAGGNYTNYIDLRNENKKHAAHVIREVSGIKTAGFEYECFASTTIADRNGLDQIAVINAKGRVVGVSIDSNPHVNRKVVKKAIDSVEKYYTKQGVQIGDKSLLVRVVYFSSDPENNKILVQSGGPNVLDAAIIESDKVVDIIEVKKLHKGGAQMPSSVIEVNEDGSIDTESLGPSGVYLKEALENISIQDADGHNVVVDFGSKEKNEVYPLYHFVEEYKRKGAKTFLYTSADGSEIREVDLNRPTKEVVEDMKTKGIYANIKLRANIQKRPATETDIARLQKTGSEFFKDGKVPEGDNFNLKDLVRDKLVVSKNTGRVKMGSFVLPVNKKDLDKDILISKKDLEAFRLTIAGDIKVK